MRAEDNPAASGPGDDRAGQRSAEAYSAYLDRIAADLKHPLVRDGFSHWRGLLQGRRYPFRNQLDPTSVPRTLSQISLIDVTGEPAGYRVRLIGHHTHLRQGIGQGDDLVSVRPDQGRDRILARIQMVLEQGQPVRGVYRYMPLFGPSTAIWAEVVSCPLTTDGTGISHVVSFGADFDADPPPDLVEWP